MCLCLALGGHRNHRRQFRAWSHQGHRTRHSPSISPRRQQRPPMLAWLHGPKWQQRPLRLACSLWGHIPQALTWSQVLAQTLGIWRALFGNRSNGQQQGPPRLHQCHKQKYGPWQLPRHKHHHRPWWQAGHLHRPTLHLSCRSRSPLSSAHQSFYLPLSPISSPCSQFSW